MTGAEYFKGKEGERVVILINSSGRFIGTIGKVYDDSILVLDSTKKGFIEEEVKEVLFFFSSIKWIFLEKYFVQPSQQTDNES